MHSILVLIHPISSPSLHLTGDGPDVCFLDGTFHKLGHSCRSEDLRVYGEGPKMRKEDKDQHNSRLTAAAPVALSFSLVMTLITCGFSPGAFSSVHHQTHRVTGGYQKQIF